MLWCLGWKQQRGSLLTLATQRTFSLQAPTPTSHGAAPWHLLPLRLQRRQTAAGTTALFFSLTKGSLSTQTENQNKIVGT